MEKIEFLIRIFFFLVYKFDSSNFHVSKFRGKFLKAAPEKRSPAYAFPRVLAIPFQILTLEVYQSPSSPDLEALKGIAAIFSRLYDSACYTQGFREFRRNVVYIRFLVWHACIYIKRSAFPSYMLNSLRKSPLLSS